MKRTENLYKELKEKIENLVEFMVSNDLNAADINLEVSEEFTLCNVKYKDSDDIKDEFLYLYSSSEKLKESYYEKLKLKEFNDKAHSKEEDSIQCPSDRWEKLNETRLNEDLTSNEVQNDKPAVDSNTASKIKENELAANIENNAKDTEVKNTSGVNIADDVSCEDKNNKLKPIENVSNTNNKNNNNKNNNNKNNKDKFKNSINFKEELIFQREIVLNILKEYNLIS